jgi:hypothetical protein
MFAENLKVRILSLYRGDENRLRYLGSAYEGEPEDSIELALHEICHIFELGVVDEFDAEIFEYGSEPFHIVENHLEGLWQHQSDLHEIRTVAAECLLVESLGLELDTTRIVKTAGPNLTLKKLQFVRLVELAKRTPKVQRIAEEIKSRIFEGRVQD